MLMALEVIKTPWGKNLTKGYLEESLLSRLPITQVTDYVLPIALVSKERFEWIFITIGQIRGCRHGITNERVFFSLQIHATI